MECPWLELVNQTGGRVLLGRRMPGRYPQWALRCTPYPIGHPGTRRRSRRVAGGSVDGYGTKVGRNGTSVPTMHIVCVSHLRWDFVFQRPQHLLSRATKKGRVLYVEEPVTADGESRMEVRISAGVRVAVPHLSAALSPESRVAAQRQLLHQAIRTHIPGEYVLWYYTPMALEFTEGLKPAVT